MILIADSGSTKTDWRLLVNKVVSHSFKTQGFAPFFIGSDEIKAALEIELIPNLPEKENTASINNIYFYGAGFLILLTNLPPLVKGLLTIEPLISLVVTFGGIYFLWLGMAWVKYVIMISGILLTLSYITAITLLIWHLLFVKFDTNSR